MILRFACPRIGLTLMSPSRATVAPIECVISAMLHLHTIRNLDTIPLDEATAPVGANGISLLLTT